ncbi:MAG TPA: hypothetical protein ENJ37_06230 [Deltaproteobacteria bacterium]|nr:hypothetical protein [Deltaproteobacteria bacterium]
MSAVIYRLIGAVVAAAVLLLPTPSGVHAQDEQRGPATVYVKFLFGFDAKLSGTPLTWVSCIFIDPASEEVYLLDSGNSRVVVTDREGIFLYQFRYSEAGLSNPRYLSVDPRNGDIYMAENNRIAVLNYRGDYKRDVDLTKVPDYERLQIQSFYIVYDDDGGGRIYMGDNTLGRVVTVTLDGEFVGQFVRDDVVFGNVKGLYVDEENEELVFLDPGMFSVFIFGLDGEFIHRFGRVSSLMGGFSMATGMAVDKANGRIIVVDTNRMMIIGFDWDGKALFEFGGPTVFKWPRAVGVDFEGRIYVADNTGVIKVFEVVE